MQKLAKGAAGDDADLPSSAGASLPRRGDRIVATGSPGKNGKETFPSLRERGRKGDAAETEDVGT